MWNIGHFVLEWLRLFLPFNTITETLDNVCFKDRKAETGGGGIYFADGFLRQCFQMHYLQLIYLNFYKKFVSKDPINSKSALVHVMAWCQTDCITWKNDTQFNFMLVKCNPIVPWSIFSIHNRYAIAHLWGRGIGCLLWAQSLWSIFCISNCGVICNILSYWRVMIVVCFYQHKHYINLHIDSWIKWPTFCRQHIQMIFF